MIGRAAKQAIRHIGDHAVGAHPAAQIFGAARLQKVHAEAIAVLGK
jgi:hypothetical protein